MAEIFIATPNLGWICTELAQAMPYWLKNFSTTWWAPVGLKPISYARNWCASKFMESDANHFWLIDADISPPKYALGALLSAEKDVVATAVKVMKIDDGGNKMPVNMLMRGNNGKYYEAHGNGLERIDRAGFGCILFHRRVFEIIPFPWFELKPWGEFRGTDFIFCEKLERAGIPLYARFDVACGNRAEVVL